MFDMIEMIMPLFFIVIIGIIIFSFINGLTTWHKNNQSPRLTVWAKVVTKRVNVSHHNHPNAGDVTGAHGYHTVTDTRYYVTFEVESGDRMEFFVSGSQYGMLVEGDEGKLTFQGTRYLSFDIKRD